MIRDFGKAWTIRALLVLACSVAVLSYPAASHAAASPLLPNGDHSSSGIIAANVGACSGSAYWECVNENATSSPNDADYIQLTTGDSVSFQMSTVPLETMTALTINTRAYASAAGQCSGTVTIVESDGTVVATGTGAIANVASIGTGTYTGLSLSQSQVDGLRLEYSVTCTVGNWVRITASTIDITYSVSSATVVADGDATASGPWSAVGPGPCTSASYWECVNEQLPGSPNDADYISATGSASLVLETSSVPSRAVTSVHIRIRARSTTPCMLTVFYTKEDNTTIYLGTPTLTSTMTSYSGATAVNLALTQGEIDGARLRVAVPAGCGTLDIAALSVDLTYAAAPTTVSGTVSDTSLCNGATGVVGVGVNGSKYTKVPCTPGTGAFSSTPTWSSGDMVTAFIDDATPDGALFTKTTATSGTPLANVDVVSGQVRARSLAAAPITTTEMLAFDVTDDSDVPIGTLSGFTVFGGNRLVVQSGTLQATSNVTAGTLWVRSSAAFDQQAYSLDLMGSGTGVCDNSLPSRPLCVVGSYTPTGTVRYRGSGALTVSGGAYAGLELIGSTSNTFHLTGSDNTTLTATSLLVNGTAGAPVMSTSSNSPTITINGDVTVSGTATLSGSGTGTITVDGNLAGDGGVNMTGGTVVMAGTSGAATTLNASGTLPGAAWQFANLRFTSGVINASRSITIPATSREIRASGNFLPQIWTQVDASALTRPITVGGDVQVAFGSTLVAPPLLDVAGSFINDGTFTPGSGTVRLSGSSAATLNPKFGGFYDLEIVGTSKTVSVASDLSIGRNLIITGGSCAGMVTVRSSSVGVDRSVHQWSGTTSISYARLGDLNATFVTKYPGSSDDLGGNTGFVFGAPCAAPTVSGTVNVTTMCDGTTPVVGIAVNAVKRAVVPCIAGTGAFSGGPNWAAGDIVTTYLDGVTPDAVTYTRTSAASSTPITGVPVMVDHTVARSLSATPITDVDMDLFDRDQDPDIDHRVITGTSMTTFSNVFMIGQGTFQPAVDVTTGYFWVRTGATYDAGATRLRFTLAGQGSCSNAFTLRPFCIAGTFVPGTGTVEYAGSGAITTVSGYTYHHLVISTPNIPMEGAELGAAGQTTINVTGDLTINGHANTVTFSPTINVDGNLTVSSTGWFGGGGTGNITVDGNVTGDGDIALTGGRFTTDSPAHAATTLNASGTTGNPWQFYDLWFSNPSAPARTVTVPATSREIRTIRNFRVDSSTTVNMTDMTQPVRVGGTFTVVLSGQVNAPPLLQVQGDFQNAWNFFGGTGTVELTGAATTSQINFVFGSFNNLSVTAPSKTVNLYNPITVTGTLTLNGGACTTPVRLATTTPGSGRTVTRTSATVNASYASVQDITFTGGAVTAANSGDLGGNSNFTATGTPCTIPTVGYVNTTDASAGSVNPTNINGRIGFKISADNVTGTTVDNYRSEVTTSMRGPDVKALYALNGSGADRSDTANAAVASGGVTYPAGASGFSQAAQFDGVDDMFTAPTTAAYDAQSFTLDLWMRATSIPNTNAALASRGNGTNSQFALYFSKSTNELRGQLTVAGVPYIVRTPGAPWLDDTWHHVAFTVDSSRTMRLYVDGVPRGTPVVHPGPIDTPAEALRIGGTGSPSNFFLGQIDDVQLRTGEPDVAGLIGYARTRQPHAQAVFQSSGYSTPQGTALTSTCATATRCADITYGGPDIHREGARYYARTELRTTAGLWTPAIGAWFETGDAISVSAPGSVALPTVIPGIDQVTNFSATTTCGNPTGCALQLTGLSDLAAMATPDNGAHVPHVALGAPVPWAAGAQLGLGFTVLGSTSGKDAGVWGAGTDFSDLSTLRFTGAGRSAVELHRSTGAGAETTQIGMRWNPPTSTLAGDYETRIRLVAVPTP